MNKSSVSFEDDWPVQADDPLEMALDQPFLPTHDALKTCSGSDIHLVKGASNPSNRCLAILPGLLALHPPKATDNNNKSNPSNDHPDTSEKDTDAKTATKPEAVALGEMKGLLSTETPTLRMGFCMELQGQRVRTSSKFLVLTLQPKKKRVICKHIFDSVVLFGQAQIRGAPQEAPEIPQPWVHYGGSARAGTNGSNVSCRLPSVSKEAAVKPRVDSIQFITPKVLEKEKLHNDSDDDDDSESDLSIIKEAKDEDDFHMDIVPSSLGRRASSQRKVKAPVKYLERELESSDSSDESDEEAKPVKRAPRASKKTTESMAAKNDDDVVVVPSNSQTSSTPASRRRAKVSSNTLSSDSEDDYVPLKRAGRAKKTSNEKVDSNEENDVVVVELGSSSTRAASQRPSVTKMSDKKNKETKSSKRVARVKKITDESSDEEEVVEVLPSNQSAPLRASRGKQNAAVAVRKQKVEPKDEVVVIDGDKATRSPRKRKSPPVTQSQDDVGDDENDPSVADLSDSDDDFEAPTKSSSTKKSKSVPDTKAPPAKRPRGSAGAMDSLASTATTPTRRRRRTGTTQSPSKKSVATTFFQSSNDFSF